MTETNKDVSNAIQLAARYHEDQARWDGTPYILHPLRVMAKMGTNLERIVAVLHDAIEDNEDVDDFVLKLAGVPSQARRTIDFLTHHEGQTYEEYIQRIKMYPIAKRVKIQDLLDNLNVHSLPPSETGTITEKHVARMNKYIDALKELGYYRGQGEDHA